MLAALAGLPHSGRMKDPLFARAQQAIEEGQAARKQRHSLLDRHEDSLKKLRLTMLKTATVRREIEAKHGRKNSLR